MPEVYLQCSGAHRRKVPQFFGGHYQNDPHAGQRSKCIASQTNDPANVAHRVVIRVTSRKQMTQDINNIDLEVAYRKPNKEDRQTDHLPITACCQLLHFRFRKNTAHIVKREKHNDP